MEEGSNKKSGLVKLIERFIHGRKKMTAYEIQDIIKASEGEGLVNEEESEMIRSIFSLRSTVVREVMVPRIDMACVSVEASIREFLETILACGHSRIPVYENSVDNVIGLLYAKDLLKYWGLPEDQIRIRTIMRPPYFIPETKNLEQLLQEFKSKHVHLAIVIDEYGGTSGLITIEDLLEQIVGDIQDEHDREEALFTVNDNGSITADARMPIEDLEEQFGIEIERDQFDTVGGLIFHLTGRIAATDDIVENRQLRITILDADERKIKKVCIARIGDAETDNE
ncbi:MAG: HlyC/CorC family transporter [Desulfuromonadales bacterium]|nr:HlyC/CorC family transporter [Desulfuromonadales bacterium]